MNADEIIEAIKALSLEEQREVAAHVLKKEYERQAKLVEEGLEAPDQS